MSRRVWSMGRERSHKNWELTQSRALMTQDELSANTQPFPFVPCRSFAKQSKPIELPHLSLYLLPPFCTTPAPRNSMNTQLCAAMAAPYSPSTALRSLAGSSTTQLGAHLGPPFLLAPLSQVRCAQTSTKTKKKKKKYPYFRTWDLRQAEQFSLCDAMR